MKKFYLFTLFAFFFSGVFGQSIKKENPNLIPSIQGVWMYLPTGGVWQKLEISGSNMKLHTASPEDGKWNHVATYEFSDPTTLTTTSRSSQNGKLSTETLHYTYMYRTFHFMGLPNEESTQVLQKANGYIYMRDIEQSYTGYYDNNTGLPIKEIKKNGPFIKKPANFDPWN